MRFSAYLFVVTALLSSASPLAAQSLADVAKQEQDRRNTVKNAGKETQKTFTNKDLPQVAPPPQVVSSGDGKDKPSSGTDADKAPGDAEKGGKKDADAAKGDKKEKEKETEVKDQAYWSARIAEARQQLDKDITFAAAMQSRINALTTDFVNRDDAAQRSVIANDRDRAMAELKNLETAIQKDKDAIAAIEEEARKASVPAGWLR